MTLWHAAVPALAGLLALEYAASRRERRQVFDGADTLADVGCAVLSQIAGLAVAAITVAGYRLAEHRLAMVGWGVDLPWRSDAPLVLAGAGPLPVVRPGALASWVAVFLLVDVGQYLVHRLSHRVNLLWACHAVHHSSGELNLAVAVRNSSFHGLFIWVFFLPGAWLGVPWHMVAVCYGINVLYQFVLHTRMIGRLGPLERVLNTPSHHRVHHGREPKYLDRNFGGVLIVWDRLGGTFQGEEEEPDFGPPLSSYNPVWANVHGFAQIAAAWRMASGGRERLRAILGPPELLPDLPVRAGPPPSPLLTIYAAVQILAAVAATLLVVLPNSQPVILRVLIGTLAIITVGVAGGLLDRRPWARTGELVRLMVVGLVLLSMA